MFFFFKLKAASALYFRTKTHMQISTLKKKQHILCVWTESTNECYIRVTGTLCSFSSENSLNRQQCWLFWSNAQSDLCDHK